MSAKKSLISLSWPQFSQKISCEEKAEAFAAELQLIPSAKTCPECSTPMKLKKSHGKGKMGRYRCCKTKLHASFKEISLQRASGTIFENSNLLVSTLLSMIYSFVLRESYDEVKKNATTDRVCLSTNTISLFYQKIRTAIKQHEDKFIAKKVLMGGYGKIVQIDETKHGKRKYHRGKRVNGTWYFGMIQQDTKELRILACAENKRDESTLLPMIQENIAIGTTIWSDKWAAYSKLPKHGYQHQTVNHSKQFKTKEGVHTNLIESSWRPFKRFLQEAGPRNPHLKLAEYQWRRRCRNEGTCPFVNLCHILSNTNFAALHKELPRILVCNSQSQSKT